MWGGRAQRIARLSLPWSNHLTDRAGWYSRRPTWAAVASSWWRAPSPCGTVGTCSACLQLRVPMARAATCGGRLHGDFVQPSLIDGRLLAALAHERLHLVGIVLGDTNAIAVVPVIAHVATNHKRAVLDAPALAILDAVRRLVVDVVENHHRRVLRVADGVELPVAHLALAEEGLARVGEVGRDDGVLVLLRRPVGILKDDDEEVALEMLHLLLRLLDHVARVHAQRIASGLGVVVLRIEAEQGGHSDLPLVAVEERDLGDRLERVELLVHVAVRLDDSLGLGLVEHRLVPLAQLLALHGLALLVRAREEDVFVAQLGWLDPNVHVLEAEHPRPLQIRD
mmetsp:Transcript_19424/g.44657  ORF Transcript_19424/g.44657 Transcript_19424/m.44657 type:complete len:339 (+) Transcript_19424:797-1813(+)